MHYIKFFGVGMENNLKIEKVSAPDMVCEKIKEQIQSGVWRIYEKIPSENELAGVFGVNRLTVRIALQKLNTLGILETRVGDGTYVRSFDFDMLMQEISEFYITSKMLKDVSEFRMLLETECARLAVQRATDEEIRELKQICQRFEEDVCHYAKFNRDSVEAAKALLSSVDNSLLMHCQICKMSHNMLLQYSFTVARGAIRKFMLNNAKNRIENMGIGKDNIGVIYHWKLYNAMEARDFSACEKVLSYLINSTIFN
jgi:GntR family transcriptional repressor for pyruvate dehydrogenase complex